MFVTGSSVLAYLDPGTGSLVLQVLAAVIISGSIVFRRIVLSPFVYIYRWARGERSTEDDFSLDA